VSTSTRNRRGSRNPNWKGGNVSYLCAECGSAFEVPPYRVGKALYCSLPCWNEVQVRNKVSMPEVGYNRHESRGKARKQCEWCGVEFCCYPSRLARLRFCSSSCHGAWRASRMSEEKNPNWCGGMSRHPYPHDWRRIASKIMERDGWQCRNSICLREVATLNVHHIDYDKSSLTESSN
jgi:hypothetical protein